MQIRSVRTPGQAACALLVAGLALGVAATAQTGRPQDGASFPATLPPLAPARPLRLPAVTERTLPNGLRIVFMEDHSQPAVWIRLVVPAGYIRDPADRVGLARMTADLLNKGTTTRSETEISDLVDGLGASLGASASPDNMTISATGLSPYASTLMNLMADIALRPTFPNEELERARTRTENSVTASLAAPATVAEAALNRVVYGTHPYGNFASGTAKTLPAITDQDVTRFHSAYFVPNGSTLFVVGDIKPADALGQAEAAFGSWERKSLPSLPAPPHAGNIGKDQPLIMLIDRPGSAQTEVRVGTLAAGRRDPKRYIAGVASAILGLGQFDSRLTQEIRVKRGLTYGVASYFDRNAEAGKWAVETFTKTASTGEVVKIALEQANRLANELPGPIELQEKKDFLNGSFAMSVATPDGVLARLIPAVLYGDGPDDLTKYVGRIEAVTSPQVQDVMKSLNLKAPYIVLVGDAASAGKQVAGLGKLTRIPADSLDLSTPALMAPKQSAPAGGAGTPEERAAGQERLSAAINALGGEAFLNVKSAVLTGKGEFSPPGQNINLPAESAALTLQAPDRGRMDLKTAFGSVILASPGGGAAGWISALGHVQDAPPSFPSPDPFGVLRRAAHDGAVVRALPDTEAGKPITDADGKPLRAFEIMGASGAATRVYTLAGTGLVSRISVHANSGDVSLIMSDYHMVQGVQLPGRLKLQQGETTFLNLTFTSFEVNAPVKDGYFTRPQ